MKKLTLTFLFILLLNLIGLGQSSIPVPKRAKKSDDRILISSEKDVHQFSKYLRRNGQPTTLVFSENINATAFFEQYPFMDEVTQLVLKGNNQVNNDLFCKLTALKHVLFYVKEYDSTIVNNINDCPYLTEVSYFFSREYPATTEWFKLNYVETINILGIMDKNEMERLVPALSMIKKLRHVRFSADFTKDLPKNIGTLNLEKFGFIDNLSLLQNITFYDLAVENYYLNYWDETQKKSVIIPLDYFSDRVTLEDYDKSYLSSIFYNAQVLPYYAFQGLDNTNTVKITANSKVDGQTGYSVFDTTNRSMKAPLYFKTNPFVTSFSDKLKSVNSEGGYEHFTIDSKRDNVLITQRGYKVLIPGNAFVDDKDETVSRWIDIYFKYIYNSADFMLAAIPSDYDSFNNKFALNNAQVVMLYASEKNIPLKLKRGYAIDVELSSSNGRSFLLSTDEPYWYPYDETGQTGLVRYKLTPQNDTFDYQQMVDFADINQRYYDPQYFYILDKKESRVKVPKSLSTSYKLRPDDWVYQPYERGMTLNRGEFYLKPGKSLVGARKISFTDTLRRKQVYFTVYNKVDKKLFPELQVFKKYLFEYVGDEEKKTFTKTLLRGKKFNDFRIHYKQGNAQGIVELKYDEGYVQLPFVVVKTGTKQGKEAKEKEKFYKKFLKYSTILEKRNEAQKIHIQTYNKRINETKEDLGNKELLSLLELGTFAWATLDNSLQYSQINVVVNDAQGIPLDIKKLAIIYNNPSQVDYFTNKSIKVNFAKEFAMLATDFEGNMYYMTASQCKGLKSGEGSVVSINARLVTEQYYNWEFLYKAFGFAKLK